MKPDYDPVAETVPEEDVDIDNDEVYWLNGERLNGFLGETLPNGNYEFISFKDGLRDGPTGEITPQGDLVYEERLRKNFLYGITRYFRADGTLARAVGYEYGVEIWTVKFEADGRTVHSSEYLQVSPSSQRTVEIFRRDVPLPPLPGPEAAADLSKH